MYEVTEQTTLAASSAGKRPALASDTSTKKRAPYAPRACDACRRRKGRCSGDNPCTYCVSRSLECGGHGVCEPISSASATECVVQATTPPRSLSSRESQGRFTTTECETSASSRDVLSRSLPEGSMSSHQLRGRSPDRTMLSSLGDLVASLQVQVGALTTKISAMERNTPTRPNEAASSEACEPSPGSSGLPVDSTQQDRISPGRRSVHPRKRFCGPTSPDYSLNMAQMRMKRNYSRYRLGGSINSSNNNYDDYGDDDLYSGEDDEEEDADGLASNHHLSGRVLDRLTGFRRLLGKHEAIQLIYTYQAVFGDFHPIIHMQDMISQLERWYEPVGSAAAAAAADEGSLLLINLVLAIALCAEPTSDVDDVAKTMYTYCCEAIGRTIVSPSPAVSKAVILLLVGTYHFFKDDARFAWRMAGLAGNMLLELGLHSRDVPEDTLGRSETERTQAMAIICTTIVLDRQWSAATGLPTHFHDSELYHAMKVSSTESSPYLRAMVAFMAVSDKFTSPISRVAKTGQPYEQDDTFDILNFQIEQWRKNALDAHNFSSSPPKDISRVPSWAVLLNLRANAAHSMLLRPFFFFNNTPSATARKHIGPAMHYFSDTINILSNLDRSTEVYRKQTPFYLHLLASACALMSLVVAHVVQHHHGTLTTANLPDGFGLTLGRSFRKAFALAEAYSGTSGASRKLWKRLDLMAEPLVQLSVLPVQPRSRHHGRKSQRDVPASDGHVPRRGSAAARPQQPSWQHESGVPLDSMCGGGSQPMHLEHHLMQGAEYEALNDIARKDMGAGSSDSAMHSGGNTLMPTLSTAPITNMRMNMDTSGFNNMANFSGSSVFYDWPFMEGQTFFSEGELLYEE